MLDNFRFETFVDVHSNIFAEYLSSVIAKLSKENSEYRSIEERIEGLYFLWGASLCFCGIENYILRYKSVYYRVMPD